MIPEELRWCRQWCVAGPDPKGTFKAPYIAGTNKHASISNPEHWTDYETACEAAALIPGAGVGFVLTAADPYCVIDLDVKDNQNAPDKPETWTTPEQFERFGKIVTAFDSYSELSTSGKGVHIWLRGNIGEGCKRDGVEIYSQERFIVCTGNAFKGPDIKEGGELLFATVAQIRAAQVDKQVALEEHEQELEDQEILDKLMNAANADKFNELCIGDWASMGYPSQSEADLALMSMFTFHSKSNEQCRRLFRMTGLGKREKAVKNDVYLNRTLRIIRGRQARELGAEEHGEQVVAQLMQNFRAAVQATPVQPDPTPHVSGCGAHTGGTGHDQGIAYTSTPLEWPPGFAGRLAQFVYNSATRPVKEVGIVTALGFLAGVCGKTYTIPDSGTNLYIVLVALSAIGKEAMHSGMSKIVHSLVASGVPSATDFIDFTDYASGPALIKAIAANTSFVNVAGEWGRKLKRLAVEDGRDGPMQQLRTVMTNLYQKSAPNTIVGGLGYSDREKSIASVSGVAYSMIGETTPSTFYDSLTETMMEDGFLSRFTIIEYTGDRPDENTNHIGFMDQADTLQLGNLVVQSANLKARGSYVLVQSDMEGGRLLRDFNLRCDNEIRSTKDEGWRQMWNRAHLKAYRIAALLAAADNYLYPCITQAHAQWAIDLVMSGVVIMSRRLVSGDIGTGDGTRERKLLTCIAEYMRDGAPPSYAIPDAMRKEGVIARKYLQVRVQKSTAFTQHKIGSTAALDTTLRSLCDSGYIMEVDKNKVFEKWNFHGKCYRVLNIPTDIQRATK